MSCYWLTRQWVCNMSFHWPIGSGHVTCPLIGQQGSGHVTCFVIGQQGSGHVTCPLIDWQGTSHVTCPPIGHSGIVSMRTTSPTCVHLTYEIFTS